MNSNLTDIKKTLQDCGIKITLPRVYIYQTLLGFQQHPSAEELFIKVNKKHPGISLATIYKTLEVLVQNNIIKKVVTDEDKVRYDHRTDQHIHLYCEKSKQILDYEEPELEALVMDYFKKKQIPSFDIHQIQINIKGELHLSKQKR
jgi:Fur family transcriptional regulator, peroxide stress response regulator